MNKIPLYCLIVFLSLPFYQLAHASEKVTLQLKWFHQFQFAGYYAAKEKGFYEDLDLDVEIKEKKLNTNNIEQVIKGEAQYGVADSVLILYKAKNESVVIVSPIFQHSPSVLLALKKSGINSAYDLDDKDITFYKNDNDGFAILAMLNKLNVKPNLIRKREKNDYLKLINENIDVSPAYLSNELFYFQERNVDVNIINPMNYGVDLYGDMLFTNQDEAQNHPERVKKFKEATLKGWQYALDNKEEIIQLIHTKYNNEKSIAHLRYEADAIDAIISKETTPIGTLDKGRFQYIYELYEEYGVSLDELDLQNFIFEDDSQIDSTIKLTDTEQEYLLKHPVLKVQNMSSFPPYNFNKDNTPMGYSIDLAKLLSKKIGVELEFVSGKTWQQNLEMLGSDELDVLLNVGINEERKKYIDFTDFKVFDYILSVAMRKGSTINSMADLQGKTIAVLNKSFLHATLQEKYPEQALYIAPTITDAVEAVSSGRADAVIGNFATIEYYINENWLSNLHNIHVDNLLGKTNKVAIHLGVTKGNVSLKSILEKANASITHSELLALKQKWLNTHDIPTIQFTPQELFYLKLKKELNMCIDPNWLPFEKIEKNKHIGMTAEYIAKFQKELPIPIKLINTKDWLETVEFSKQRKCDFVSIMTPSQDRKNYFNFTKPLMNMPIVIATQHDKPFVHDISSVITEKIGITEGFGYSETLIKAYPNINLIQVKNAKEGLQQVQQGTLYGFIGVLPVLGYNINENYIGELKIAGKVDDTLAFPMATRIDHPLLNSIFNKLIGGISAQENKDVLNKWLSIKYEEQVDYTYVIIFSLFLMSIILIVLYKNRSINQINSSLQSYMKIVNENVLTSSTDIDGKITYVSDAFCKKNGYTKDELIGKDHRIFKHEDIDAVIYKDLWARISQGKVWKGELKNKMKNGNSYWVIATITPLFDAHNKINGYTSIRHDITDKKRIEEISITDALTNIYNRRHFNDIFPKYLNSLKRDNGLFAFLIMDVDFFKQYNDTYGHQQGDQTLQMIAQQLKDKMHRADDYCFRLGGEEFGILFKCQDRDNAFKFVETIRESIEALQIKHSGSLISQYVTVSIGLYSAEVIEHHNTEEIYKDADDLLYKAKKSGRNQTKMNNTDN